MQFASNVAVLQKVLHVVKQITYIGDKQPTLKTRLSRDLALGGFSRLKLAMYLEEAFDVEISDEALEQFVTVEDVVKFIGTRLLRNVESSWLTQAAQGLERVSVKH